MSDISKNTPIRKFDQASAENLKTHEARRIHKNKERSSKWLSFNDKDFSSEKLLYAAIIGFLQTNTENPDTLDLSHLNAGEKELYGLLTFLKSLLLSLSSIDKSKDAIFLQKLSETWNFILLAHQRRQHLKPPCQYIDTLDEMIYSIESYGSKDQEALGYYLKAHKNQDWFPIPYLNMLTSLHDDHKINNLDSLLSKWLRIITILQNQIANPE
ncbi:MAG: hypothetical protein S4CHLAM20_06460 [Chlamydiia bacterium]|nr:hypothetical protein [Chlamydiia bacterium]